MKLSLKGKTTPIELEKQDGTTEELELREMVSATRDQYLNRMGARMKLNEKRDVIGVQNFEGLHSDLLSLCLFRNGKPVDRVELEQWPAGVTSDLYAEAQRINLLNKSATEAKTDAKKA